MNAYSSGMKSVLKQAEQMGRGGDTILAHINPEEAMMLKRMGGSGGRNPMTGLREYKKAKDENQLAVFWKILFKDCQSGIKKAGKQYDEQVKM